MTSSFLQDFLFSSRLLPLVDIPLYSSLASFSNISSFPSSRLPLLPTIFSFFKNSSFLKKIFLFLRLVPFFETTYFIQESCHSFFESSFFLPDFILSWRFLPFFKTSSFLSEVLRDFLLSSRFHPFFQDFLLFTRLPSLVKTSFFHKNFHLSPRLPPLVNTFFFLQVCLLSSRFPPFFKTSYFLSSCFFLQGVLLFSGLPPFFLRLPIVKTSPLLQDFPFSSRLLSSTLPSFFKTYFIF